MVCVCVCVVCVCMCVCVCVCVCVREKRNYPFVFGVLYSMVFYECQPQFVI